MTEHEGRSETATWRVKQVVPPAKLAVEAYVFHKDILALGIPGVAVLADPLAKDTGPQGFANYLNALEAKAGLLDEARKALVAIHAAVGETYKQTNIAKESLVRLAAQQGEKA